MSALCNVDSTAIARMGVNQGGIISNALTFNISAPTPSLTSLSPSSAITGGSAFTLTANGSGFAAGSNILWNGLTLSTSYISATLLTASVATSLIAASGTASVSVQNPGGTNSNAVTFAINPQALTLSSVSPNSAVAGGSAFTLTANGSGFAAGSNILWNGSALSTSYISGTQLTASVPGSLIASAGSVSILAQNPGGASSTALTFTFNPQQTGTLAILTASPPPNATVGGSYSQGLTATGGTTLYKNWTLVGGIVPPGLALSPGVLPGTELLSGTPSSAGTFTFTLSFLSGNSVP